MQAENMLRNRSQDYEQNYHRIEFYVGCTLMRLELFDDEEMVVLVVVAMYQFDFVSGQIVEMHLIQIEKDYKDLMQSENMLHSRPMDYERQLPRLEFYVGWTMMRLEGYVRYLKVLSFLGIHQVVVSLQDCFLVAKSIEYKIKSNIV